MWIVSLIASLVLLGIIISVARSNNCNWKALFHSTIWCGLIFSIGPAFLFMSLMPVMVQAVLLILAVLVAYLIGLKPRSVVPLLVLGSITAYGIIIWAAVLETQALREQYPIVSMEEQLPPPHKAKPLPVDTQEALTFFEQELETSPAFRVYSQEFRLEGFKELHQQTVSNFVRRPGFGFGRWQMGNPLLRGPMQLNEPVFQPGQRPPLLWSLGDLEGLSSPPPDDDLYRIHREGILDFVNPRGFGYFKDRRYVVGFQEHHFSKIPEKTTWKVQTLDLIGLVVHKSPVVYVSDQLPRMGELKKAPTRPLDQFEIQGLSALEEGQDLFVRDVSGVRRMVGAVRSAKQCVACHGGERGDLLGAFSYTLKKSEHWKKPGF